jgi:hypothetical protein
MMNGANVPRGAHPKRRGCAPYKFFVMLVGFGVAVGSFGLSAGTVQEHELYSQEGTDPTFESLLAEGVIPVGSNSTRGVTGSVIRVKHPVPGGPIPKDIAIHTLCNASIPRRDFAKWTRWYQEDGNTQIFRLFKDETNVRNDRKLAGRIEAFGGQWDAGITNVWHEWEGTYTIVKPHGAAIFQSKNNLNDWSVMINLSDSGDIKLNHRRHQEDVVIATNMTGKSFALKVRDNGRDYEVYFNGQKVGAGHYDRPAGKNAFRWGLYVGANEVRHDAMIFVTGARFR